MLQQQLEAMQINRIIEYTSSEYIRTSFFPQTAAADWVQHEAWMKPHAHVSVRLSSNGAQGVITGDMIHSPFRGLQDMDPYQGKSWLLPHRTDPSTQSLYATDCTRFFAYFIA